MWVVKWKDKQVMHDFCVDRPDLLPMQLRQRQDVFSLFKWLSTRVFQDSRLDYDELMTSLGLKEYNVWDIARKTKAILTGVDFYSVEWVDEEEKPQ